MCCKCVTHTRHICRFGVPTELVTDQGTQFVNETFTEYLNVADIQKIETLPHSKEDNSIVERANK
jgi:transposase InsO family protein